MILAAVAPVFVIIAIGFLMRRMRVLTAEADATLLRICVNLLYPCLIGSTIVGNALLRERVNLWLPPLAGAFTVAVGYVAAFGVARLLRLPSGREVRTFVYVAAIYNYGYTAIPLVEQLFGQKALGVLFMHNLGVEVVFWVGASLILARQSGGKSEPVWRSLCNPPVVAIVVAMLLNLAGAGEWLPRWIFNAMAMVGASAIPMALLLTGATLCDFAREARPTRQGVRATLGATVLRLAILPFVFLALARWLPCPLALKQVLVVQSAMPCAMLPIVLTKHHKGDTAMAVQIVIVTTALALFTIPYWIRFGLRFAGIE